MTGPPWWNRAARWRPHADIAVSAVLFAVTLLTTPGAGGRLTPSAVTMAGVACGALVMRRSWPVAVLVVCTIAAEGYLAHSQGRAGNLVLAAPLIALYTVADMASRRRAWLVGILAVLVLGAVHAAMRHAPWLGAQNLALAALGALAVAAGDATRSRRGYTAAVEERAHRAEWTREHEARRRVVEERLRIARDLHDVLGHQLALINVQAGVADHVLERQPVQARQALGHIRQACRVALTELRDTIGLLREPGEPATPTEPRVGLAGLDDLLATFRRSGLCIEIALDGAVRPLPPAPDLTAYRVLQESLTNVCKHAGPAQVRLRLTYRPGALSILVVNEPGPAVPGPGDPGHGIVGMRERVTALGGTLRAAPRFGGGFLVAATLPLGTGAE